ncbi:MAG: hypothetical protein JWP97_4885 [Labilithrix sp.]|nr:hypothetical protein [Labilithrix sp.]
MTTPRTKLTGLGVSALAAVCAAACSPSKAPNPHLSASESWCPEGFEVGPQDTCFAVPETTTRDTPVLVYLHGMYVGHGSADEWKLVHSAIDKGFAVVVPRGKRGLCAWKEELKDHFCWPQESEDPQAFKNVVAEWDRVLWQVDAILEGGSHKRYVLGYSNGGFFAEYLAAHDLFPAQAYAIVNGGSLPGAMSKPAKAAPMMLVAAEGDSDQAPKMKELHDGLAKAGWLHAYCTRPGAHPLASQDLDASLRFFKHDAEGGLKASSAGYYGCDGATNASPDAAQGAAPSKKK